MWQSKIGDYIKESETVRTSDEAVNINIGPENNFSPIIEVVTQADIHEAPQESALDGMTPQPRGACGDANLPHTAAAPGLIANFGQDWQSTPRLMYDMMAQQQQMMKQMSELLPAKRAAKVDTQFQAVTPAKKAKVAVDLAATKFDTRSEGELSGQDQDLGDLDRKLANLIDEGTEHDELDDVAQKEFNSLHEFFDKQEKTSQAVADPTAAIINAALRASVPASREKELLDRVLRPDNCPSLTVPKVNPEIWREMKKATRDDDVSLQKIQLCLLKGFTPLVHVMDSLRSSKDREALSQLGDTFKLLALASSHLSSKRKELIAPDLAYQYRQLCSANRPVSQLLFGDELQKTLRDIKEAQSVGARVSSNPSRGDYRGRARYSPARRGYQHAGSNRGQGQGHSRGRFLSRGGQGRGRRGHYNKRQDNKQDSGNSPAPK